MVRRINKFLRFSLADKRLMVQSAGLLVMVQLGLFLFPFKTLLNFVERMKSVKWRANLKGEMGSDRIGWAVVVVSRHIPLTKCLTQALVAQILFARYGYQSHLRIGVAKDGRERIKAHAWVERKGKIVIGDLEDILIFSPLPSLKR